MPKSKPKRDYRVSGKVIDKTTNEAVSGLRIEAWDKDEVEDDILGYATTSVSRLVATNGSKNEW